MRSGKVRRTAKEVAVQTQPVPDNPGRFDRLPPVELTVPAPERPRPRQSDGQDQAFAVHVADAVPGGVEVRYGLDPVANVWVASFFDGSTGEFVKTVPATKVMDQLAELRAIYERSVDRRA
jgi:hypothetical protein